MLVLEQPPFCCHRAQINVKSPTLRPKPGGGRVGQPRRLRHERVRHPPGPGGPLRCSYRVLLLAPQKCLLAALKHAAYAFANTGFLIGSGYILQRAALVLNVRISDTVEIGYDDLLCVCIYNQVWVMSDDDDLASFFLFLKYSIKLAYTERLSRLSSG